MRLLLDTHALLWLLKGASELSQSARGAIFEFDRLIVAQALSEKCTLVSRDTQLDAYGISRLW